MSKWKDGFVSSNILAALLTVSICRAGGLRQPGPEKVIGKAPFTIETDDYVLVVSDDVSKDGLPLRKLAIYVEGQETVRFSQETPDAFLGVWPSNGKWIATIWERGSALVM